jgi:hypothetical protein
LAWECHDILQVLDQIVWPYPPCFVVVSFENDSVVSLDVAVVVFGVKKASAVVFVRAKRCVRFSLLCIIGFGCSLPGGIEKVANCILT